MEFKGLEGSTSYLGLGEIRDRFQVLGNHSQGVTGRHEEGFFAQDHVSVAVSVKGGSEGKVSSRHDVHQVLGVGQVGVGMAFAKVLQELSFQERLGKGDTKLLAKDSLDVGA